MPEKYRIIITPEAQTDIRNIISYIAWDLASPKAALNLQDVFRKEIESLSFMPERIKILDDQPWKDVGIRRMRVKNYYIYFLIDDEEVSVKILAVIYAKRDQDTQLSNRDITNT